MGPQQHFERSTDETPAMESAAEAVRIPTDDGLELRGRYFAPQGRPLRATVLINGGTAIPQTFYTGFADHLRKAGFGTLTYDFRGVGESRPDSLRGFEATKTDWGHYDFTAAFDWLEAREQNAPRFVVGHSVGGQLLGLMRRPERIDAVVTIAASFGYWRNMPVPYRYFVGGLWYVGVPFFSTVFGYVPAKRLGLGEDLPSGVARDWARWGKRRTYFVEELGDEPGFGAIRAPWKAIMIEDDDVATVKNARPLLRLYRNADISVVKLRPNAYGYDEIGHLGFFSRRRKELWPQVSEFFEAQLPSNPRWRSG